MTERKEENLQARVQLELSKDDWERLLVDGDLSGMTSEGRVAYYKARCDDLGLSYQTRPFDLITTPRPRGIPGPPKIVLYANKSCSDQLGDRHHISCKMTREETDSGIYTVWVTLKEPIFNEIKRHLPGDITELVPTIIGYRELDSVGATPIASLGGDSLANAKMKTLTKAYRRGVLALKGVSMIDETEIETIRGARVIRPEDIDRLTARFDEQKVSVLPTEETKQLTERTT